MSQLNGGSNIGYCLVKTLFFSLMFITMPVHECWPCRFQESFLEPGFVSSTNYRGSAEGSAGARDSVLAGGSLQSAPIAAWARLSANPFLEVETGASVEGLGSASYGMAR